MFEEPNVALAEGDNVVTLGRLVRTFTYHLANDTMAPSVVINWPPNNSTGAGNAFTLRGHTDDPTADIEAVTTSGKHFFAMIDRDGNFTIDVTLEGTETVTLTGTDAAGNSSPSVSIVTSPHEAQISASLSTYEGSLATVYVSVFPAAADVTINGQWASGSGTSWSLPNANIGGPDQTAMDVNVTATFSEPNVTVEQLVTIEKSPVVKLALYSKDRSFKSVTTTGYNWTQTVDATWNPDGTSSYPSGDVFQRNSDIEFVGEQCVAQELKRRRWTEATLTSRAKGHFEKVKVAARLRRETIMTLKWIAQRRHRNLHS